MLRSEMQITNFFTQYPGYSVSTRLYIIVLDCGIAWFGSEGYLGTILEEQDTGDYNYRRRLALESQGQKYYPHTSRNVPK